MYNFIAAFLDELWEDAHARNLDNLYYHHPDKCGAMTRDDQTKGSGNNVYIIRRRLCSIHNVYVGESGWEFGLVYGTISKSLNPSNSFSDKQ
jgi:hypothetical protein